MKQKPTDLELSFSTVGDRVILHLPAEQLPHIIRGDYPGMEIIVKYKGERFKFTGIHTGYNAYQLERDT